jgi:hypothetical protein
VPASIAPAAVPAEPILDASNFSPALTHEVVFAVSFAAAYPILRLVLTLAWMGGVPARAREFCHPSTLAAVGKAHDQILRRIREDSIDLDVPELHETAHLQTEMRLSVAFPLTLDTPCPILTIGAAHQLQPEGRLRYGKESRSRPIHWSGPGWRLELSTSQARASRISSKPPAKPPAKLPAATLSILARGRQNYPANLLTWVPHVWDCSCLCDKKAGREPTTIPLLPRIGKIDRPRFFGRRKSFFPTGS